MHLVSTHGVLCRWLAPSSFHVDRTMSRGRSLVTAMASVNGAGAADKPRPKSTLAGPALSEQQSGDGNQPYGSTSRPGPPRREPSQTKTEEWSVLNGASEPAAHQQGGNGRQPVAEQDQQPSSLHSTENGRQSFVDIFQQAAAQPAKKPRPRRSSSASKAAMDEAEQARAKRNKAPKEKRQLQGTVKNTNLQSSAFCNRPSAHQCVRRLRTWRSRL